jgi:hypothetical protein
VIADQVASVGCGALVFVGCGAHYVFVISRHGARVGAFGGCVFLIFPVL